MVENDSEIRNRFGLVLASSLTSVNFDRQKFWEMESNLNLKPSESNIVSHINGHLPFFKQDKHGYLFYALQRINDDFYRAVAYFKTHTLLNSQMLIKKTEEEFGVTNFDAEVATRFGVTQNQTQHMLEFGGAYTQPEYRRLGYASILLDSMFQEVSKAARNGQLSFFNDDNSTPVNPDSIVIALVAKGNLKENPHWIKFKKDEIKIGKNITSETLTRYGIDPQLVGKPREQSIGTEKLAKKKNMTYVGINLTDGGPVYTTMLKDIS